MHTVRHWRTRHERTALAVTASALGWHPCLHPLPASLHQSLSQRKMTFSSQSRHQSPTGSHVRRWDTSQTVKCCRCYRNIICGVPRSFSPETNDDWQVVTVSDCQMGGRQTCLSFRLSSLVKFRRQSTTCPLDKQLKICLLTTRN